MDENAKKYLDVLDNELDRIHVLLRYGPYEKSGGDYDELIKIMKRFQIETLRFGKHLSSIYQKPSTSSESTQIIMS